MSRSGTITVIVETPPKRWSGDPAELIRIIASTERESEHVLSDKEWFREEWNMAGEYLLWDLDDRPGLGKRFRVKGHLWAEQDYWGDWDGGFEIESCKEVKRRCKGKVAKRKKKYGWIVPGVRVDYHAIIGGPVTTPRMVVREPVQELTPGQWVTWLKGKAGCVAAEACTPSKEGRR